MIEYNGYYFTNKWFEFAFSNPEKINPSHTAMYLWIVQLNNKMQWAEKFASPASQTMQAIGLKSYNTYKKIFNELVDFGFIKVITESKNQYTACIIALSRFDEANSKANNLPYQNLTEHVTKQSESTIQSTDSIIKQETNKTSETLETLNLFGESEAVVIPLKIDFMEFWNLYNKKIGDKKSCEKKWDKLPYEVQLKIIDFIPDFISSINEKQYQPYPATFLNQERWNDDLEILNKSSDRGPIKIIETVQNIQMRQ
jgi:hypothetical protein